MPLFIPAADTGTVAWQELLPESMKSNDLSFVNCNNVVFGFLKILNHISLIYIFHFSFWQ